MISTTQDVLDEMLEFISGAGKPYFKKDNPWETSFCTLVMTLQPRSKIYKILEALPYHDQAMDQPDMLNAMANFGYLGRPVEIAIQTIDQRLLPCLYITKNETPLVLLEKHEDKIKICNNGEIITKSISEISEKSGTAWIFELFDDNRQATSKFMREGSGHSWFRALFGRFKGTCGQILLAGLMLNIIALTTPVFIMLVYDRVIASASPATLPMLLVGACIATIFEWKLRTIRSKGLSWLASRMDNIVGNKIFSHLTRLPPDLIEQASVAAQVARIKTFESVRDFFSGSMFLSLLEMPFVILAAIAIFAIAGPLALVPLTMAAAYLMLFFIIRQKVRVSIRLAAKASSARQLFAIETFEKIRGIRSYGLSEKWQEKFRDLSGKEMMAHFRLNWLGMVSETCAHALTIFSAIITVCFGVHLIWAGVITTGALVATMILVWRVLTPFYSLCTMIPRLEQVRNSVLQVNKLMELDTETVTAKAMSRLPAIQGKVEFSNVSLRYGEKNDQVLTQLNFQAAPGDLIAITGENGSGKTSLLKMIKGMYAAENGTVSIDGFDIRQLDTPDLRRQISYMPQQNNFFAGSIVENLRMANPLASLDKIQESLQLANAWSEISSMPESLHTKISLYGNENISPNLMTRLSLARMYLHPASIILIDEMPNSLLSSAAGKNLKEYLARVKGKRTVFMVTYREDFMRLSDTIIHLKRGKTPSVGPRETLMNTFLEEAA